ncbi:WD repeat-containing protein 63 [Dufourea novaeangliae]|uniref:WD repeat-containing protein 63 n=1 Tax=Dufourea novaeangliae TaxID=178035 RepID=A0A154PT21_DUFNO|nr:WD repeat-containing protein 63 [Dufourea novaeangliae]
MDAESNRSVEGDEEDEQKEVKIRNLEKNDVDIDQFESSIYVYDLFDEVEEYEYVSKYEKEWDDVERDERLLSREPVDWEKEVKETVHLEIEPKERRRTIYQLDSYASSGPSVHDILKLGSIDDIAKQEPRKEIRYSTSMGMPGIARINLSPLTQKVIGCVIGENVSTEYPWVYIRKEIIQDNIDLHEESSDFLPVKDKIYEFPDQKILIGYVPSLTQEGQFYICLTPEGQEAVIEYIRKQREGLENRVRNAVYKPLGKWEELGSSVEIEATIVTNTRPLLELEYISTAEVLNTELQLVDRAVDDQIDGYVELLPYRQTFENISRRLMQNATQVTRKIRDIEAQTVISTPTNCWSQYGYEYKSPDISSFNEEQLDQLRNFLRRFTDEVCDEVLLNDTWDIYTNDYMNLVHNSRDTQWSVPESYKEHLSFHYGTHVVEKVINDVSWHTLWTGVLFAAYTRYSKSHRLVGPKLIEDVLKADHDNYVLVWSFNDSLTPKLILECTREVTTVVVWHIPGKIEQIETVIVKTPAQVKHKLAIRHLTTWLRQISGTCTIRPTAMSSLKDSQRGTITHISWLPPYNKVDENGIISSLPEDVAEDELTVQFLTASDDGTIAFWDLKRQKLKSDKHRIAKKKWPLKRPATMKAASPYKHLDRIFQPHYLLIVQHPDISRRVRITTLSIFVPTFEKKRVDLVPPAKDITVRRFFKNIVEKPDYEMLPRICVGTVEGDFGCVEWKGFEFSTDVTVHTETCEWSWCKKVHDGPITHSVRPRIYNDIVATIGGKIFAIWKETFDTPLMWKKSTVGYSAASWGSYRPTVLILARMDGSIEIWDFVVKSEEPCIVQSLSGRIITGIYTHPLYLNPQCVGFCDFNGALRMFLPPDTFLKSDKANERWMTNFIKRQVMRIENCRNWQKLWRETHHEIIEEKQRLVQHITERKKLEETERAKDKLAEADTTTSEVAKTTTTPLEIIAEARERWKAMELKRMQHVLLEKKGLRKDELERQREPILKMREDAQKKKEKLQETLNMQNDICNHTMSMFFPERQPENVRVSLSPPMQSGPRKTQMDVTLTDTILQGEVLQDVSYIDPDEEIVYNFMETQTEVLAYLQKNPLIHTFDWRTTLREGKSRRVSMDYQLENKFNKAKKK